MIGFSEELASLLWDYWWIIEDEVPSGTVFNGVAGGTMTARTVQDLAPIGEFSPGDRVVLEFADCGPDAGNPDFRIDGTFTYVAEAVTISGPTEEYVTDFTLSDLRVRVDGLALLYRGSLRMTEHTDDGITWNTVLDIPSLRSTVDVTGVGTFEQKIENAALTLEDNEIDDDWAAWVEGDFYDSGVGGVMELVTVAPFEGSGDDSPREGVLEIRGAGNSKIRLTALDTKDVRIEVDEDGDDVFEETIETTWDAIRPG